MLMLACATGFRVSPSLVFIEQSEYHLASSSRRTISDIRPRTLLPALAFTWAELFVLETWSRCQRALKIQYQSVGHNIMVTLRLPKLVVRAGGVLVCCTTPQQRSNLINAPKEQFPANCSGSRSCTLTVHRFVSFDKNFNPTDSMDCTGWQAFGKLVGTPELNSDKGGSECKIPQGPERAKPCTHADGICLFCVLH